MTSNHETVPFSDLDLFLKWVPLNDAFEAKLKAKSKKALKITNDNPQELAVKYVGEGARPRVMVCHDHKDNYEADRFYEGSEVINQVRPYTFNLWPVCDIFVYFDHKLISYPPRCFTEAAHNNGTLILATIITENEEGQDICEQILGDDATMELFVSQCIKLARHEAFDGYLVNIENKLKESSRMIELLRRLCERMHSEYKGESLVIWYDAVTVEGELKWQNELNNHNKAFFDVCDGIYLNYNWNKDKLESSKTFTSENRYSDIFVGLDIFGRGMIGNGGFNTSEALEIVDQVQLSSAIFAPGWTQETIDAEKDSFMDRDLNFWRNLWPFLTLKGPRIELGRGEEYSTHLNNGCKKLLNRKGDESLWYLQIRGQDHLTPFLMAKQLKEANPDRDPFPVRIEPEITDGKGVVLLLDGIVAGLTQIPFFVCDLSIKEGSKSAKIIFDHENAIDETPFQLVLEYTDKEGNLHNKIISAELDAHSSTFNLEEELLQAVESIHLLSLLPSVSAPKTLLIKRLRVLCH